MKLTWGDIAGGATPRSTTSLPGAGITPAESGGSAPGVIERANDFLDTALDMLRKIDQVVGMILDLKGKTTIEGEKVDQTRGKNQANNPGTATPTPDAILALLDQIVEAEGDIPLSKFAAAIRNQEPWLLKYAQEVASETGAKGT